MPTSSRHRLVFDAPSQITDLRALVVAISDPATELGDVDRYAKRMVEILTPALQRYEKETR